MRHAAIVTGVKGMVFSLLISFATRLWADEQTTEESMSPDYKHEVIFFKASPNDDAPGYEMRIRVPGSENFLYEEFAGSYAEWKAAVWKANYRCLWSPDGRYVAIFTRGTKTSGLTAVFAFHGTEVEKIVLPALGRRIRPHLHHTWRSSWLVPELWLPDHELMLTATGTTLDDAQGSYRFVVKVSLHPSRTGKTTAEVVTFRQDRSIPYSIP